MEARRESVDSGPEVSDPQTGPKSCNSAPHPSDGRIQGVAVTESANSALMSAEQVRDYLALSSVEAVRHLRRCGRLPGVYLTSKLIRYRRVDVERLISESVRVR